MGAPRGFEPPPYPYDRLDVLRKEAEKLPGGVVDLSIGTPYDPPPAAVVPNLVYGNGPSPDAMRRVLVRGRAVVVDGEHVSVDRREAVRRSDELQEALLDEVDARRFVRMRSRFNWS